jgi:hypothetical protein
LPSRASVTFGLTFPALGAACTAATALAPVAGHTFQVRDPADLPRVIVAETRRMAEAARP